MSKKTNDIIDSPPPLLAQAAKDMARSLLACKEKYGLDDVNVVSILTTMLIVSINRCERRETLFRTTANILDAEFLKSTDHDENG